MLCMLYIYIKCNFILCSDGKWIFQYLFHSLHIQYIKCIYAVLESIDYTFIINIAIIFNKGIKLGQNTTLHALLTCKKLLDIERNFVYNTTGTSLRCIFSLIFPNFSVFLKRSSAIG